MNCVTLSGRMTPRHPTRNRCNEPKDGGEMSKKPPNHVHSPYQLKT